LQYVAVCCSVLQCVAVCCSTFIVTDVISHICHMQCVAVCCSMLQCVAGKIECMRERYVECCSSHVYIYFVWMDAEEVYRGLLIPSHTLCRVLLFLAFRYIKCCSSHHTLCRVLLITIFFLALRYVECCSSDYTLTRVLLISSHTM